MGYLLDAGMAPEDTYQLFAIVLVVAGLSVYAYHRTYRGRSEDPETPDLRIGAPVAAERALVSR